MHLNKHCLRVENDVGGYQALKSAIRYRGEAVLLYDVVSRRLQVSENESGAAGSPGRVVCLGLYTYVDLPTLSLQVIYDQLAEALEERWWLGWVNG